MAALQLQDHLVVGGGLLGPKINFQTSLGLFKHPLTPVSSPTGSIPAVLGP